MSEVEKRLEQLLQEKRKAGATVSMRELNQKTRDVIARVRNGGETLTVTDRGEPVAEIRPVGERSPIDLMEEAGLVVRRGGPFKVTWELAPNNGLTLEQLLKEEREDVEL